MAKKLPIWDMRMLDLMQQCVSGKIKCTTDGEWCKLIGIRQNGIAQIRKGLSSFRHQHIANAAKVFNISPNYIYGLTNSQRLHENGYDPISEIRSALVVIEKNFKPKLKQKT